MSPSQDSLYDQLLQVRALANKAGYYDAADFLSKHIDSIDRYTCRNCLSGNTIISSSGYHNTVLACQDCHSERQIYLKGLYE